MIIPFNKPYTTGKELEFINESIASGQISGNGNFTQHCHNYIEENLKADKVLLTTSCTDALEMAAILTGIGQGDEVIVPAYTFCLNSPGFYTTGSKNSICRQPEKQP